VRKAIIAAVFIAAFSVLSFAQTAKEQEVISVAKRMLEAQENYDAATLEQVYASDYIEISPKGEVDEREKAIGFYKIPDADKMKARTPKYILDEFKVRHYGKYAMIISRLAFGSKTDTSRPPMIAGRVVFALRKEKGGWKIYSAQFTPIPPPRPAGK
jgi:ketosteroid isomerase-like protein